MVVEADRGDVTSSGGWSHSIASNHSRVLSFLPFHPGPPRPLSFSLSLVAASLILCCSFPNGGECHWLVLWLFNLSSLLGLPYCSLLFIIIRNCFALPALPLPFHPLFPVYHLSPPSSAQVQTYCERCVLVCPYCLSYPSLVRLRCAVWLRAYDCHRCAIPSFLTLLQTYASRFGICCNIEANHYLGWLIPGFQTPALPRGSAPAVPSRRSPLPDTYLFDHP